MITTAFATEVLLASEKDISFLLLPPFLADAKADTALVHWAYMLKQVVYTGTFVYDENCLKPGRGT